MRTDVLFIAAGALLLWYLARRNCGCSSSPASASSSSAEALQTATAAGAWL